MFADRADAGRRLAARLLHLSNDDVVVLGLPRGGVPVAAEIAAALGAPLDVILVRTVGVPFHPELTMGAVGEGDIRIVDEQALRAANIPEHELVAVENRERHELEQRSRRYRGHRPPIALDGRTVIVVADGIATDSTAKAACQVARADGACRVIVAAPVASPAVVAALREFADDVVVLATPTRRRAVGRWYHDFTATSDDDVAHLLEAATTTGVTVDPQAVDVRIATMTINGDLRLPDDPRGLVLFAQGSGSGRDDPRNHHVADVLNEAGFATLVLDLLTPAEETTRANVFDIDLLGSRLAGATRWAMAQAPLRGLPLGYFGASTGAAAAMWAAAEPDLPIAAIVSRGGRPELAGGRVPYVQAPTLLIVGARDDIVIELNQHAARQLRCEHRMVVVNGATHVFPESGALEAVGELARDWYFDHFAPAEQHHHRRGA